MSLLLALPVLATSTGVAAAAEPERLEPSSSWNVDYSADSCILRRAFGPPERRVTLELHQFAPGDSFRVFVGSSNLKQIKNPNVRAKFDPDHDIGDISFPTFLGSSEEVVVLIFRASLRPNLTKSELELENKKVRKSDADLFATEPWPADERDARESSITGMTVRGAFARDLTLLTGPMRKPMDAIRSCSDELLTHWGIDAAAHKSLSRPVLVKNRGSWAQSYPVEMLRKEQSGFADIRLIIGPDGKPRSCNVQMAPEREFGQSACSSILRFGRFDPALDASGNPIQAIT